MKRSLPALFAAALVLAPVQLRAAEPLSSLEEAVGLIDTLFLGSKGLELQASPALFAELRAAVHEGRISPALGAALLVASDFSPGSDSGADSALATALRPGGSAFSDVSGLGIELAPAEQLAGPQDVFESALSVLLGLGQPAATGKRELLFLVASDRSLSFLSAALMAGVVSEATLAELIQERPLATALCVAGTLVAYAEAPTGTGGPLAKLARVSLGAAAPAGDTSARMAFIFEQLEGTAVASSSAAPFDEADALFGKRALAVAAALMHLPPLFRPEVEDEVIVGAVLRESEG